MNEVTVQTLQAISATNQWTALVPELSLGCFALLLLFLDLLVPKTRPWIGHIALAFQAGLAALLLVSLGQEIKSEQLFGGLLVQNEMTQVFRLFFLVTSFFVTHLGMVYLRSRNLARVEFYHLVLIVTAAFMVLVQANSFILLFVALETLTIGFYVLVAYGRTSSFSLEAGLKYLVMGAFSSAILLFGITLLYGVAGNPLLPGTAFEPLQFDQLASFISSSDEFTNNRYNLMVAAGTVLVLAGVAFKIGVVPFQIWIPDVYQGAPTPVTAFLAVGSKAGGFFVLSSLLRGPFAGLEHLTTPLLTLVALLTIVFGNIAALGQRNVKRVMGMSGVAHAGIVLMGVLAAQSVHWAYPVVVFYLGVYALASFGVFEVIGHVAPEEDSDIEYERFDDLLRKSPFLGSSLLVGLGSLAGIPPLAGFIAKVLIFYAAFQAELYLLMAIALGGVVVSIYYYFSWMRSAIMVNPFLEEEERPVYPKPKLDALFLMGILMAMTILIGLYPGLFLSGL